MDIRPLHDRLIVRRLEEGEQKIGGIIIPDTAKEKPQQGRVLATGSGKVKADGDFQYFAAVHFPDLGLGEAHGMKTTLTMWADCKGHEEQRTAEKVFHSVQFPSLEKP